MFGSIYRDLKDQINFGNNVTKLIIVNVIFFIAIYVSFAFIALFAGPEYTQVQNSVIEFLSIPSAPIDIVKKPWTIFTHMFVHRGLWHFVWNMLLLYWFGRIFGDLMGDKRVIPLYLLAGFAGAMFFVLGSNLILGQAGYAMGASAAVLGILIATAYVAPDYHIHMILIGAVKLKWVALAAIILDLIGISNLDNTGGHFGHIGGMVMGWFFITLIHNNNDPSPWFNNTGNMIVGWFDSSKKKKKSPLKVRHKANVTSSAKSTTNRRAGKAAPTDTQNKLDKILDKISKNGISSLTKEEKDFLDNASKNS